jgi:pilus assembly protein CpaE
MPPHLSLVIIESDIASRTELEAMLRPFGDTLRIMASVGNMTEGLRAIQATNPMVVILELNEIDQGVDDIKLILSRFPRTSVFVTSANRSTDWILRSMRAGAIEYLLKPVDPKEMGEAMQKVGRLWVPKPAGIDEEGKIIAVYNPVGGMGTTTIAVNLAAKLCEGDKKVALVDLNLFGGDVDSFLDFSPKYTLSSVTTNISRLDANFLMSVMTRHSSGIYVLTEPHEVDEASEITPEQVRRVLAFLKEIFSYVIIDTGGHLAGCNLTVFENSDHVLFNTVLSLPALKNAKRYLAAMGRKGLRQGRVQLIVNRYLPRADIRVEDAEKVLGWKVLLTIPNEYTDVIASINKGVPLVKLLPRSSVARAFARLAELVKL